jgi:hypothetical protein
MKPSQYSLLPKPDTGWLEQYLKNLYPNSTDLVDETTTTPSLTNQGMQP